MAPGGDLRSHTTRGIFWTLSQVVVERGVQAFIFFVVAKLIGASAFGVAAIAIAPSAVTIAVIQGANQVIVQRREIDEAYLRSAFTLTLILGVILAGATLLLAPLLADLMARPELTKLVYLSAIGPLGASLGSVPDGILTKKLAFRLLAIRRAVGVISAGVVCLTLAYLGYGALSIVTQTVLTIWVVSAISLASCGWRPRLGLSRSEVRDFSAFAGKVFSTNALIQANIRAVDVLIGYFLGPAAAGTFRLARTIMDLITSVSFNPLATVLLPIFSRMEGTEDRRTVQFLRVVSFCLLVFCGVSIGVVVCSRTFSAIALGPEWHDLGPVLALLGLVFPTMALSSPMQSFMIAVGRPGVNLISNGAQFVSNLLVIGIGVHWGILGATAAYVLRAYGSFVTMALYFSFLYPDVVRSRLLQLVPPLVVAFVIVAITEAARYFLRVADGDIVSNLAITVVGFGLYVVALRWTLKQSVRDALDLIRLPPLFDNHARRLLACRGA